MLTSIALLLIIAGAFFLLVGLKSVRHILHDVSGTTVSWRIILIMILIFLAGYIVYGFVLINQPFSPVMFIVAFIFAAGGIFVSLIINLISKALDDVNNYAQLKAEKAQLEISEKQLRQILDHTYEGILIFNTQGQIQNLNSAAQALFGYQENELTGQGIGHIFISDNNHSATEETQQFIHNRLKHLLNTESTLLGKQKNGETIPVRARISPVDASEDPVYAAWLKPSVD